MIDPLDSVTPEEMENARNSRRAVTNPPEFDAGMGGNEVNNEMFGGGDPFGSGGDPFGGGGDPFGSGGDPFGSGGDPFGSGGDPFGNGTGIGMGSPFGAGVGGTNAQGESIEDKFFGVLKEFFKSFIEFFRKFVATFKEFDVFKRMRVGRASIYGGVLFCIIGLLLLFINGSLGWQMIAGALVTVALGMVLFMFSYDAIEKQGLSPADYMRNERTKGEEPEIDEEEEDEQEEWGQTEYTEFESPADEQATETEDEDEVEIPTAESEEEAVRDMEGALNRLENVDAKMITRQFLYETYESILPRVSSDYDQVLTYDEDSQQFLAWDALVQKAADIFRTNQEDSPYLVTLKDKLMYTQLNVSRVKWIKNADSFLKEIVNVCRFDADGNEDKSTYGSIVTRNDEWIIKIYKGGATNVSIADAYRQCKDFVLNVKNAMPVVLGYGTEGEIKVYDFDKINALCVTGQPRSGKSWFVQAMIAQMVMYNSPETLHLYLFDPKDVTSDFRKWTVPHVRQFSSKNEDLVNTLRYMVKTEGARRAKLIGDANCVKIQDYKKKYPDVELPYIYVFIDEIISFSTDMKRESKELFDEFQGYLKELVSRLPSYGIRLVMIPHVLKHDIIQKTTTDLIPCRISVMGNEDHIESTTGATAKEFPHKLGNVGDMAVLMNKDVQFIHSVIVGESDADIGELAEFLTRFWLKLRPESYEGSYYQKRRNGMPLEVPTGVTESWNETAEETGSAGATQGDALRHA